MHTHLSMCELVYIKTDEDFLESAIQEFKSFFHEKQESEIMRYLILLGRRVKWLKS